jgi:chromosome segregation ATPase
MEKDGLRRQLEDMEEAVERGRVERRRLNAEIDKLESELADAKAELARRRATSGQDSKGASIDPAALLKIQEAADDKLKRASSGWETEKSQMKSQISRLEGAVAEAIARASNPMRATQSVKEQFEVQLNRVAKEKTELEQAFLRSKTEWEQERLKMTGEMVKLRRTAQIMGRPVPKAIAPETNLKVLDVEAQLRDSLAKWNSERQQLVGQIHRLEESARQWDAERRQLNDHAAHLQQAFVHAEARIKYFEVAAQSPNASEEKVQELKRDKEGLQRQMQDAQTAWDAERRRLEQQLQRTSETRGQLSNEVVDQLRKQYEQRLQEAILQKTQLATELQSASALLEAERTRLVAAQADGRNGVDTAAITAEISRVERQLSEVIAVIDSPDTELATVIRKNVEKAELDAYLKGILFSTGKK